MDTAKLAAQFAESDAEIRRADAPRAIVLTREDRDTLVQCLTFAIDYLPFEPTDIVALTDLRARIERAPR